MPRPAAPARCARAPGGPTAPGARSGPRQSPRRSEGGGPRGRPPAAERKEKKRRGCGGAGKARQREQTYRTGGRESGCGRGEVRRCARRSHTLGSARLGSARLGSARLGSARLGSARLGSARLGSARLGSARLGSARLGSARLGSARLGSARLGSARLGSAYNSRVKTLVGCQAIFQAVHNFFSFRTVANGIPRATPASESVLALYLNQGRLQHTACCPMVQGSYLSPAYLRSYPQKARLQSGKSRGAARHSIPRCIREPGLGVRAGQAVTWTLCPGT